MRCFMNCILLLVYGRGGFNASVDKQRHSIGNPAVNPAVMIGTGFDPIIFTEDGIIGFTAKQIGKAKAVSERNSLNSRDTVKIMSDHTFHGIEERFSQSCGYMNRSTFQNAANTVTIGCCRFYGFFHPLSASFIQNRKVDRFQFVQLFFQQCFLWCKSTILNAVTTTNMST